jgi:hypothetical protein
LQHAALVLCARVVVAVTFLRLWQAVKLCDACNNNTWSRKDAMVRFHSCPRALPGSALNAITSHRAISRKGAKIKLSSRSSNHSRLHSQACYGCSVQPGCGELGWAITPTAANVTGAVLLIASLSLNASDGVVDTKF